MPFYKYFSRNIQLRFAVIILLVFAPDVTFCQKKNIDDNKLFVSVSPFALIDYKDGSSVRLSAELKVLKNISFSAETFFYTLLGNYFSYKTDARGIGIKPCIKYYLNKTKTIQTNYLGIEFQYKYQTYSLNDSIAVSNNQPIYKKYGMERIVTCINIKYGTLNNFKKRFLIEYFGGAGIRFRNSATNLTSEEYKGILRGEKYYNSVGTGSLVREIGKGVFLNLTLGLKLGYKIL